MLGSSRTRLTRSISFAIISALPGGLALAQESPCDKGLEKLASGPHGYTLRNDRCEGIYAQEVSGTPFWIASLTQTFEDYDPQSGGDLIVAWDNPGTRDVRLRAQGVSHDVFYRMDAIRPPTPPSYRWPSDVLAAQHLPRDDIGVLAWTPYQVGGTERQLFLPLRIRQRKPAESSSIYTLVLFPTTELREVYISLDLMGADGRPKKSVRKNKPLAYGYYGAEAPVSIQLGDLSEAGIYHLEIGADLAEGGSAAVTGWVYRAR
ncbi:MAG: hypothetical protein ACJ8BF_14460 [Gemmatimonadales bacterium]